MLHLVPGDPVRIMLATGGVNATAEDIERLRTQLGLNDPILVQYTRFLSKAITGDLGRSLYTHRTVVEEIMEQLPSTLELTLASLGLAILLGVFLGIISAVRYNSWVDTGSMILALLGVSIPEFWLSLMVIFLFSLRLGWFPVTGYGGLNRLFLPAMVLGLINAGYVARLTRSSMLEVLRQEYITTARAKGLPEMKVITKHALKNAMIPIITMIGLQLAAVLSGAVIIETVFARQGIGRLIVDAILRRDFPVVQGVVLLIALGYVFINLLVDISYAFFDPHIRYS
jgi:peptide/nickel transport system permease protein